MYNVFRVECQRCRSSSSKGSCRMDRDSVSCSKRCNRRWIVRLKNVCRKNKSRATCGCCCRASSTCMSRGFCIGYCCDKKDSLAGSQAKQFAAGLQRDAQNSRFRPCSSRFEGSVHAPGVHEMVQSTRLECTWMNFTLELLFAAKEYSSAIDMWSVGVIFAEMLLHRPLFPGMNDIDQIMVVISILGSPEKAWPVHIKLGVADGKASDASARLL